MVTLLITFLPSERVNSQAVKTRKADVKGKKIRPERQKRQALKVKKAGLKGKQGRA